MYHWHWLSSVHDWRLSFFPEPSGHHHSTSMTVLAVKFVCANTNLLTYLVTWWFYYGFQLIFNSAMISVLTVILHLCLPLVMNLYCECFFTNYKELDLVTYLQLVATGVVFTVKCWMRTDDYKLQFPTPNVWLIACMQHHQAQHRPPVNLPSR